MQHIVANHHQLICHAAYYLPSHIEQHLNLPRIMHCTVHTPYVYVVREIQKLSNMNHQHIQSVTKYYKTESYF